ncbi:MAG: type II secretion system protein [Planctomycetota bacterium]|jgi:prepilin-type N-terminal cleavage/methylation domain-containing protein
MRRNGFTLIELLVVIGIISVLLTLLIPAIRMAQALARKDKCLANLRGIGQAMAVFGETASGRYPMIDRQATDPEAAIPRSGPTNRRFGEDGETWASLGPNAMQNVWLLIQDDLVPEQIFHCPADDTYASAEVGETWPRKFGWYESANVSYGMHWPYAGDGTDANPVPLTTALSASMVILADQNPGGAVGDDLGPSNHKLLGTAYLMASGGVGFRDSRDDSRCGLHGDDIYTVQDDSGANTDQVSDMPTNDMDSYICLLP